MAFYGTEKLIVAKMTLSLCYQNLMNDDLSKKQTRFFSVITLSLIQLRDPHWFGFGFKLLMIL